MKIKDGFILREVAGNYIVVSVGAMVKEFNGVINLNETSALLWKLLEKGSSEDELAKALIKEYEIDSELAEKDAKAFVCKLKEAGLLSE